MAASQSLRDAHEVVQEATGGELAEGGVTEPPPPPCAPPQADTRARVANTTTVLPQVADPRGYPLELRRTSPRDPKGVAAPIQSKSRLISMTCAT